jgi:hypothetical protein
MSNPSVAPVDPLPPRSLVLALLSNVCMPQESLAEPQQVELEPCKAYSANAPAGVNAFTEAQFVDLFYPTSSGYFYVNPINRKNPALVLSDQTYSTPEGKNVFSLYQVVLSNYLNGNKNLKSVSHSQLIQLQKECLACTSLTDLRGATQSLSWPEVVLSLLQNGVIAPSTQQGAEAKCDFKIIFKFITCYIHF